MLQDDWLLSFMNRLKRKKDEPALSRKSVFLSLLDWLQFGAALTDSQGNILWMNSALEAIVGKKTGQKTKVHSLFPGLPVDREGPVPDRTALVGIAGKTVYVRTMATGNGKNPQRLIICADITAPIHNYLKNEESGPVIITIQADNLSETLQSMEAEARPLVSSGLEKTLAGWAETLEGYLKKTGEGRYLLICTGRGYREAEKSRFAILDEVKVITAGHSVPLTLSLGIGLAAEHVGTLGAMSQAALEIALERGGDQAVVKSPGMIKYYGGKTLSPEKRTKGKARVMAHILKDLVLKSEQVIIMGHKMADYDSLGASIGVARIAGDLGRKVWLVADEHEPAVEKLFSLMPQEEFAFRMLKPGNVLARGGKKLLVVVVDTHKPSLLAEPALLNQAEPIVVIDHHRRGEEIIEKAKHLYLDPYASSSSELVTELLLYLGGDAEINKTEATALLTGIIVDTKSFTLQTRVRTFQAASYLRGLGADPAIVQRLLNDDLSTVIKKANVIRKARILYGKIAFAVSSEESGEAKILAAKTADTMLNIADVEASVILWPDNGQIAVSARSKGKINVQSLMEKLGGGGHLTVSAAQLENITLEEAEKKVLQLMEEEFR